MAGYTDLPFRLLCRRAGAELCYTEMISAEALIRGKAEVMTSKADVPLAVQLFGSRERAIIDAATMVEKKADFVDLNAGCPAPDLTDVGAGAALMKKPKTLASLVSAISSTTKKPTSVKIRLGWNANECVRICKMLDKAGAARIAIHGRTMKQGFSGKAEWKTIGKAKEDASCEIYGNGDLKNADDAREKIAAFNLDGALIGRAALGNPSVFGKKMDKRKAFLEWLRGSEDLSVAKREAMAFSRGFPEAKKMRNGIARAKDENALKAIFAD
ncbi:tRNA-dihydrouridine synthase B [Candidatus Norongarragalina meridionalis]|nr:tRNA-dihydrouridine synthase B [Candidatus Norongarragalina meridionalis]